MARIDSLNSGYITGDLSLYPEAVDTKDSLYEVRNNATTNLRQSVSYSAKKIIVEDASAFPPYGLIRITNAKAGSGELVYYASRTDNTFNNLVRGFAGSRQNQWNLGSVVTNSVSAEHHNAVKDAIIKTEINLGLESDPDDISLNGVLKSQENKFLTPKPLFRAFPVSGGSPLTVSFQNFSLGMAPNELNGPLIRCFWDFGDGSTSTEKNPIHTYEKEGVYSVELVVVSILGGQGIVKKNNYITVDNTLKTPFFYVKNSPDGLNVLETETMTTGFSFSIDEEGQAFGENPTSFEFVDQTDGDVKERYWNFNGDGCIIKKFYSCSINAEDNEFVFNDDMRNIFSQNQIFVFAYEEESGKTKTKFGTVKFISDDGKRVSGGSTLNLGSLGGTAVKSKVGGLTGDYFIVDGKTVWKPIINNSYTEVDPNIHNINFIYKSNHPKSIYNPSVFILFNNQTIKKAFLKEEVIID